MNEIVYTTSHGPVTMSSREIAELTGKQHQHVKRDIEKLLSDLGEDASKFGHIYFDGMNRQQKEFRLDRDLTENLLLGYSAILRQKVLKRLRELEGAVSPAVALNDPATLRNLLLENVERVIALQSEVAELTPMAEALDRIANAEGTFCITDAAKVLKVQPKHLFTWLHTSRWIYRRAGSRNWVAYQDKAQAGFLEMRVTEITSGNGQSMITEQVRVTAKGIARLGEIFAKEGV